MRQESIGRMAVATNADRHSIALLHKSLRRRKNERLTNITGADNIQRAAGLFHRERVLSRQKKKAKKCFSREEMLTGKPSLEQIELQKKRKRIKALKAAWEKTAQTL